MKRHLRAETFGCGDDEFMTELHQNLTTASLVRIELAATTTVDLDRSNNNNNNWLARKRKMHDALSSEQILLLESKEKSRPQVDGVAMLESGRENDNELVLKDATGRISARIRRDLFAPTSCLVAAVREPHLMNRQNELQPENSRPLVASRKFVGRRFPEPAVAGLLSASVVDNYRLSGFFQHSCGFPIPTLQQQRLWFTAAAGSFDFAPLPSTLWRAVPERWTGFVISSSSVAVDSTTTSLPPNPNWSREFVRGEGWWTQVWRALRSVVVSKDAAATVDTLSPTSFRAAFPPGHCHEHTLHFDEYLQSQWTKRSPSDKLLEDVWLLEYGFVIQEYGY